MSDFDPNDRTSPEWIDAEWLDICEAIRCSGLATWDDWVDLGVRAD